MEKMSVAKNVLRAVAIGGMTFVALTSPYGAQILLKNLKRERQRYQRYYINKVTKKLLEEKMIRLNDKGRLMLTDKGMRHLAKLEMGDEEIAKPKRWDGKYRLVIFDIPEKMQRSRIAIRRQLTAWGFVRLQNSVWVHPYDCERAIGLLKTYFDLGDDVLYLVVESIENDHWLKKEFGFPV